MLEVIKSVGLNFLPVVLTGDRKKKKEFFLVSRQVLSFKKNHIRLRTDSILQCVFMRFSTCCLHVYGAVGRYNFITFRIMSLVKSSREDD